MRCTAAVDKQHQHVRTPAPPPPPTDLAGYGDAGQGEGLTLFPQGYETAPLTLAQRAAGECVMRPGLVARTVIPQASLLYR